jgi:hypothetical protein
MERNSSDYLCQRRRSQKTDFDSMNSFVLLKIQQREQPFMPDDHSDVVPLLPISNRTVKRVSADDSADARVKVGHRQALTPRHASVDLDWGVSYCLCV